MRSMWKGAINFGLVSNPIKLYTTTEDHTIHFRQLHRDCKSPIKYEKYVLDPIYYDKTYFIAPEDIGTKPCILLRDSMKTKNRVAIAKVAIRSKQYLACIRVYNEKYIVMETMHFPDEIKSKKQFPPLREVNIYENKIKMSKQLIDTLTSEFKPEKYDDNYRKSLIKIIKSINCYFFRYSYIYFPFYLYNKKTKIPAKIFISNFNTKKPLTSLLEVRGSSIL
ncbi:Ku protein [Thermoanaerobacterium sp. RBIITD]|uniref:Ku protein n=1 Tax=Thermoanaerobacterium sp. RBIITD TaxID=1550240 RepID=UPI000BB82A6C|nr:Ku protein [Thermoanaerobacterium sp. RBIITD]SNX52732.1 Ku protein [Thermoanaerobacterium sp. RBIITD]